MAFWDTSAIIPLCCVQPASARSQGLFQETGGAFVWWGTPIEVRSALARLAREGGLDAAGRLTSLRLLRQLQDSWNEVAPAEIVRRLALELPDRYGLRALDALQLAAALAWCRERPAGRLFVCFDERLAQAAAAAGFIVLA